MKPDNVTNAMLDTFNETADTALGSEREIIAAAFNAVASDDEPITAEWLVKMGYECEPLRPIEEGGVLMRHVAGGVYLISEKRDSMAMIIQDGDSGHYVEMPFVKTIGQLRCLRAGLGIGEVQS